MQPVSFTVVTDGTRAAEPPAWPGSAVPLVETAPSPTAPAQPLAEPIPGYKLLERLGSGGFGAVWKCEAPGGLLKAIKFVHGTHDSAMAEQELRSLNRVKTVRHPYILSLERYDIIDGQLVIVMELADRSLWDRFVECRGQGLVGIPRTELLGYMAETAEALDLMNIQHQLQHLDIKPQNLFLVHHHVKVADFGLVSLEGVNAKLTSGVTPVYAAPETFEGIVSRSSDQYNLAIVYQELLTGQRPFAGANYRQLLLQHLTGVPDLTALALGDRAVIARALSKKPEERYPTCTDLVKALHASGQEAIGVPGKVVPSTTETPPILSSGATHADLSLAESRPARLPAVIAPPAASAPRRSGISAFEEVSGPGVLFPALAIGLGGLGVAALAELRRDLLIRCGAGTVPHIRLLGIESDRAAVAAMVGAPDAALTEEEILLAPIEKPSHYLKPVHDRAALDNWLNLAMLCRIPRHQTTPHGLRILGRLALVDNYRSILGRVKDELEACTKPRALLTADRQTRLGVRSNRPRVYIVAGLGGGTGSGMFIDLAYMVRHLLMAQGHEHPEVIGIFLLPSAAPVTRTSPALGNAYAALTELHHFSSSAVTYQAFFDKQEEPLRDSGAPFSRCVVVPLPEESNDSAATRSVTAADVLARELVTSLGRTIDDQRTESMGAQPDEPGLVCQTFGAFRYSVPRRAVIDQVSRGLSHRLVQSWLSRNGLQQALKTHLAGEWEHLQLQPEHLVARLNSTREIAGSAATFDAINDDALAATGEAEFGAALKALNQLEHLVGRSGETRCGPSNLTHALAGAARELRLHAEERLGALLSGLIEDPRFRVAGAEEGVLQLGSQLVEADRQHRRLALEKENEAAAQHDQIQALAASARKGSWWPGRKTRVAGELREALHEYPRLRLQALVLGQVRAIYQDLREMLPRHQEAINICRRRLADLLQTLDDGRSSKPVDLGFGDHFLPVEARTFEDAVDKLVNGLQREEVVALDQQVQAAIRQQFRSLTALCHSAATNFQDVAAVLRQQVEHYAAGLIGQPSAATLYLRDNPSDVAVRADLSRAFEDALPALGSPRVGPELRLLVVPDDPAGRRLAQLAPDTVAGAHVLTVPGSDDVFFYRERSRTPLGDLPQLGPLGAQIYRHMTSAGNFTPHTRTDVLQWT